MLRRSMHRRVPFLRLDRNAPFSSSSKDDLTGRILRGSALDGYEAFQKLMERDKDDRRGWDWHAWNLLVSTFPAASIYAISLVAEVKGDEASEEASETVAASPSPHEPESTLDRLEALERTLSELQREFRQRNDFEVGKRRFEEPSNRAESVAVRTVKDDEKRRAEVPENLWEWMKGWKRYR